MAYSQVFQTGDGTWTDVTIGFPYLDPSHVLATIDGVLTTAWTFFGPNVVRFNLPPADGAFVKVFRATSPALRLVDWETDSSINEGDLDTDSLQAFYLAQEAIDIANENIATDIASGAFDAQLRRLINLLYPTDPSDAATKEYVDDLFGQIAGAQAQAVTALATAEASLQLAQTLLGNLQLGDFVMAFDYPAPLPPDPGLALYSIITPVPVYVPADLSGTVWNITTPPQNDQVFNLRRADNSDLITTTVTSAGAITHVANVGESVVIPGGEKISLVQTAPNGTPAEGLTATFTLQRTATP